MTQPVTERRVQEHVKRAGRFGVPPFRFEALEALLVVSGCVA
jgi:hypothetical protein